MPVRRYTKLPLDVQALEWTGNEAEMREFAGAAFRLHAGQPQLLDDRFGGWVHLHDGDWVVHGDGGFYPVDPERFARRYEPLED